MNDKHKLLEELEEQENLLEDNEQKQEVIEELSDTCDNVQEAIYSAVQDAKSALEHLRDMIDDAEEFNDNYKHELKDLDSVSLTPDLEIAKKTATELLNQAQQVYHNDIDNLQAGLLMIEDAATDRLVELEEEQQEIREDLESVKTAIKEEGGE